MKTGNLETLSLPVVLLSITRPESNLMSELSRHTDSEVRGKVRV